MALADRALGELRRSMEQAGVWAKSALIVTSDHPWRDSEKWDGATDDRVPLILKLPWVKGGVEYTNRLDTVCLRGLTSALLAGSISNYDQVEVWLGRAADRLQGGDEHRAAALKSERQ